MNIVRLDKALTLSTLTDSVNATNALKYEVSYATIKMQPLYVTLKETKPTGFDIETENIISF